MKVKKEDITEHVKGFYGESNNWNGKLYTYEDIFQGETVKSFMLNNLNRDDGRKHWKSGICRVTRTSF